MSPKTYSIEVLTFTISLANKSCGQDTQINTHNTGVCVGMDGLTYSLYHPQGETSDGSKDILFGAMDGWMNGVLGHFYALSRLNWAGDNLG